MSETSRIPAMWTTEHADEGASERAAFEHADGQFSLSEPGSVAVAALLHLVRLMGSEIVLARPDCDPTSFEQAVRTKLNQFNSPTPNKRAVELGISFAQSLVDQVLNQIRAQARVKQKLKAASGATAASVPSRKGLN
jgi:hypothetical protein